MKAILTCIDTKQLDRAFAGRRFNDELLSSLPAGVDPCGENGEFHSFVYAGPMFKSEIAITVGEKVTREQFVFTDVLPAEDDTKPFTAEIAQNFRGGRKA